jgi:DNA repair and recombination protein RAD52
MTFTVDQTAELKKPLSPKHVQEREQSGHKLQYIEGWHVIAEANRIFGFDAWNRETLELREVRPPELVKNSRGKETWRVGFIARVRVTVGDVVREGTGYGSGALPDLGEAYESAVKEAETDAMKRALMTFGNPFGLALYDKSRANVASEPDQEPAKSKADSRDLYSKFEGEIRQSGSGKELEAIWTDIQASKINADFRDQLVQEINARLAALKTAKRPPAEVSPKHSLDALEQEGARA